MVYNFNLNQGDSFSENIFVTGEGGSINLSGKLFSNNIKPNYGYSGEYPSFSISGVDLENGVINYSLTSTESSALNGGYYLHQTNAYETGVSGVQINVQTILNGDLIVKSSLS